MSVLYPPTEAERIEELRRYAVLDTPPEPAFDRLTTLAARLFSVPIALVSLIDSDRQWFKSAYGLQIEQTDRHISFCSRTIQVDEVTVIADALVDPHVADNPLVCGPLNIRFYAGAPLRTRNGHNIGTLCLIDTQPRTLDPEQTATLADLAAIAMNELELRLANLKMQAEMRQRQESEGARRRSEEQYRLLFDANPQPLLVFDPQSLRCLAVNDAATHQYGYSHDEFLSLTLQDIQPEGGAKLAAQLVDSSDIRPIGTCRQRTKDGAAFWVSLIAHRIDFQGRQAILVLATDVTEQYQTQMALLASENKLKLMTTQMPNIMWTCDNDLRITSAQGTILNQLNLPTESYLGKPLDTFVGHSEPGVPPIVAHKQALSGESSGYEITLHDREFDVRVEPLRNERCEIVGCIGLATDISEHKRAEEARIASERRFRTIFERSAIGIALVSLEGRLVETNPALQAMLGANATELQGKHVRECAHPDDLQQALQLFSELIAGKRDSYQVEKRCLRTDGSVVWTTLEVTLMPAPNGEPQFVLAMLKDITARRQAEQALSDAYDQQMTLSEQIRRGRDLLRVLFDGLDDGLILVDRDGTVLAVNQHLADLLGSPPERIVGTSWSPHRLDKPDAFPTHVVFQTLFDGRPRRRREHFTSPAGKACILDLQTLPRMGAQHSVDQVILHVADVTERVHMEALVSQNETLAATGKLAATMAHEINTPLQSIRSCLYLAGKVPPAEGDTYLTMAREEIDRIAGILHHLLDLYRPGNGTLVPVDINVLVRRVLMLMGGALADRHIVAVPHLAPALPPLNGRPDQLTQVLLTLTRTVIDAMPENSTLHLSTIATAETEMGGRPGLQIVIGDTAWQTNSSTKSVSFEPFVPTNTDQTGIGLTVSQRIIEQHGGRMLLETTHPTGTMFMIIFTLNSDLVELRAE